MPGVARPAQRSGEREKDKGDKVVDGTVTRTKILSAPCIRHDFHSQTPMTHGAQVNP